jgi:hypothetical protein
MTFVFSFKFNKRSFWKECQSALYVLSMALSYSYCTLFFQFKIILLPMNHKEFSTVDNTLFLPLRIEFFMMIM